jgi:hypothetical protein
MKRFCWTTLVLSALVLLIAAGNSAAAGRPPEPPLTLRANPAMAEPGGIFAVVLRTYAARPIRQGQVSIHVAKPAAKLAVSRRASASSSGSQPPPTPPPPPIATLLSAVIFSVNGDVQSRSSGAVDATGSSAYMQFQSPSAGINAADGPLAVFYFQLDSGAVPGQKLALQIDAKVTTLLDADGRSIAFDPRPGILQVRAPGAPRTLGTDGGTAAAGGLATLAVQTQEPFAVAGGQLALRFDPDLFVGDPVVRMDPRYGQAVFDVDRSTPGLLLVRFNSPDASYNRVPGSIVAVDLTVAPGAVAGTVSPVELDPQQSWLLDAQGQRLDLSLETGTLTIR